jgi:hypothetical protein
MKNAAVRVSKWAIAGFLVSLGWGIYFANADRALRVDQVMSVLAAWTQPSAALALYVKPSLSLGLASVTIANAATYALLGLIAETIRRTYRSLHT